MNRLDVKLLEVTSVDRGWEIFQLEYKVSDIAPLAAIFTRPLLQNYLKIFSFLWKLKKVQHCLSLSWGVNMSNQTQFRKIKRHQSDFHKFNLAHHEMAHFV